MDARSWDRKLGKWDSKDGVKMPFELCVLGIVGETAELAEAMDEGNDKVLLEAGDALWYVRACCKRLHISYDRLLDVALEDGPERVWGSDEEGAQLLQLVGRFSDVVKKHAWHGKPVHKSAWVSLLAPLVSRVYSIADEFGGWDEGQIYEANIAKLAARYPNGFVEGGGVR
jgi:NTP pyrophosphatase (non-canonical NTP hydrolase)